MTLVIPTLETERLLLRPWREADFEGFATIWTDAAHSHFVGGPLSREDAWRKMATYAGHALLRGYGPFALEERASGRFVGYCGPWFPLGWPEPEIAWAMTPDAVGHGFVTEAARRAIGYAYTRLGWPTAVSVIALDNTASVRVAERLGAVRERIMENRGFTVGVWRHVSPAEGQDMGTPMPN